MKAKYIISFLLLFATCQGLTQKEWFEKIEKYLEVKSKNDQTDMYSSILRDVTFMKDQMIAYSSAIKNIMEQMSQMLPAVGNQASSGLTVLFQYIDNYAPMLDKMNGNFDILKDLVSDLSEDAAYQSVTQLIGMAKERENTFLDNTIAYNDNNKLVADNAKTMLSNVNQTANYLASNELAMNLRDFQDRVQHVLMNICNKFQKSIEKVLQNLESQTANIEKLPANQRESARQAMKADALNAIENARAKAIMDLQQLHEDVIASISELKGACVNVMNLFNGIKERAQSMVVNSKGVYSNRVQGTKMNSAKMVKVGGLKVTDDKGNSLKKTDYVPLISKLPTESVAGKATNFADTMQTMIGENEDGSQYVTKIFKTNVGNSLDKVTVFEFDKNGLESEKTYDYKYDLSKSKEK